MRRVCGTVGLILLLVGVAFAGALPPDQFVETSLAAPAASGLFQAGTETATTTPPSETPTVSETPTTTTTLTASPTAGTPTATSTPTGTAATPTNGTATTTPSPTVVVTQTTTVPDTTAPLIVTLSNGYRITFLGVVYNSADDTSTWRYFVEELASAQDLSNWVLALPGCAVVTADPEPWEIVNPDPNARLNGVKWQPGGGFVQGEFSVTLLGEPVVGPTRVAVKGPDVGRGVVAGPLCSGDTAVDFDDPTGTVVVALEAGYRVTFRGVSYNSDNTSTWRYFVEELSTAQDLSNWVLELAGCTVVTAEPEPWEIVNPDPNARLNGIKWQPGGGFVQGEFSVTLEGQPLIGATRVAVKGPDVARGVIAGPLCGGKDDDDDDDDEDEEREEPPVIVISPPEAAPVVEVVNGVSFVSIVIVIGNTGGDGRGVFLVLDLDEVIELADLRFLESEGYVVEVRGRQVVIGLGKNNVVRRGQNIRLSLKFKSKGDGSSEIRTTISYRVRARGVESEVIAIPVVIPAIVVVPAVTVVYPRLSVDRIDVRFQGRWQQGGGLRVYGLPLSEPTTLRTGIVVQYFERARFEYHPDGQVLLGLLGVELVGVQPPVPPPTSTTTISATLYVPVTGHYVAPVFIGYWQNQGGLPIFGYPIGEAFVDGNGRLVQYFERARFEYHADLPDANNRVLLGFLGEEVLRARQGKVDD